MKLQIVQLVNQGKPNEEFIKLRVLADTNLVYHIIFATTYETKMTISSGSKIAYWFDDHPVKAGDDVILYTGSGVHKSEKRSDGTSIHTFYWKLPNTLINHFGDCVVLFEINSWITSLLE